MVAPSSRWCDDHGATAAKCEARNPPTHPRHRLLDATQPPRLASTPSRPASTIAHARATAPPSTLRSPPGDEAVSFRGRFCLSHDHQRSQRPRGVTGCTATGVSSLARELDWHTCDECRSPACRCHCSNCSSSFLICSWACSNCPFNCTFSTVKRRMCSTAHWPGSPNCSNCCRRSGVLMRASEHTSVGATQRSEAGGKRPCAEPCANAHDHCACGLESAPP